ncbi:MAG: PAS domain S-box protein [Chitinispirillaceae bacterium]
MNNSYSLRFAESIVDTVREALLVLDGDLRVVFANRSFYKKFQVSREETEGRCVYRLGNGQWDIPDLRHLLSDVISGHRLVEDFQVKHVFERLGERVMLLSARLLETQVKEESFILLAVEDITDKHESAQKLRASEEMYRKFVEDINSIIIGFNRKGVITFFNSFAEKIFGYNRNEVIGKRSFVGTVVPEFDSSGNDNSDLVEELFSNPSGHYANESEGVCRDGSRIWFTWNLKVTYDGSGEGEEILIDGNDITELRKTRRQLEKKTATLDALLEFIPEGIMVSDENHMIRSVSKRMGEVLGVSVEDVLRTNEPARLELLDLYWPDGRRLVPDEHPLSKSVITGEQYLNYEVFQKQDGKTRIFSINASPIRDTRGNVTGAIGAWRDITELRTSLAVAEERRRVLDVIMEFSPVGIMLVDKTGRIVEANRLQSQYLQMSVEDIVGTEEQPDVWGILDPSTRKPPHYHFLPLCRAIREKKIVSEKEYLLVRNGNERLFALSAAPIFDEKQNLTGAITVWREITEQKKTEQQLRRSELQFRRMFEYHRAIMLLIDPNTGIIIDANDSAVRFYGYSREELRLMNINDLNQLSREQVVEEMQRALFEQRDHFIFPHKLSDGELRWVEVYSSPVQTENRQLLFSIIHDITERRKTEEALRESEERFRGIFDNAALGIVEADRDGHFIAVNEQLCQILGYTREQLLKYNVYDLTAPEDREKSNRINARLHEGVFRKYSYEKRYLKGDGSRLWVHVTVSSIYDSRNRRIGSVNTIEDISARKKIESALRGSEERFRTLADNISQLVWMATPEGEIFWFNKRWYDFTSTSLEIMKAEGLKKVIHPDFIERATTTFQESIESGKIWEFTFPMRKGDGTYRWFLSRANPIRDDAGRITRWFGTNTDISEIKRVQEELNVAAERFKRIASSNIVGVIIAGSDGSISFANDYFLNVVGYSREDFEQGRISWKEITPREFAHLDEHAIEQLQETGVAIPYEKQFMRKDGSRVWVLLADTMLPGPESEILAFVLDVTERRSALDEAEARRAEVEAILDSLPDGYILYDQNGSVVSMNDRARAVIGFTDEDMKRPYEERIKDLKILSPEGKEYLVDKMPSYRAIKYGETTRDVIMDIVRPDREYWISVSASPISANGRRLGAVMEFSDITNLRRIQEQLTGERNFVNAILDTSGAMILISDRNGRIIRFNKACEELTGFSAEELKGHSIYDLVPEDELSDVKKVVTERLLDGEKMVEHENHWITKSGERKFIRWRNTSLPDDQRNTPLIVATGIDISDRKHFENELTATNRELESFSYSVSHDLRSPLAVIGNFAAILLEDYAESLDEEGQDYLGRMIINVKKMQKLIDDILRLSRVSRQEVKREDVDLSSIVRGYLEELHSAEPKRRAEFSVQENVYASADPQLVHVALENILRNSWKYCSKRETTRVEFGAELHDGNTVYFVKDNGVGFDSEYAETIFEPFKRVHAEQEFTGTGVGLSIVKRVIDRHEGRVWAKGKVGEGAEFYFTLG